MAILGDQYPQVCFESSSLIWKYKMEVAAAVPRTYPVSLVPSSCKIATAHPPRCRVRNGCYPLSSGKTRQKRMSPIFCNRWSKMSSSARTTLASSKCDQASATTIIEPREDEEEMEIDSKFIERLELLEEQALRIGNDSDRGGREATDYNTRAQIFDKCSKVFQALKHGE